MSADATIVLNAIAAGLQSLYPARPVKILKRPVQGNRPPLGGLPADLDYKNGAFAVSMLEAESVDDDGDFEEVSVKYTAVIEYLKPSHAVTPAGADPMLNEDTDVRDTRQALRRTLFAPRIAGLDVMNVQWRPRPVYEVAGTGGAPVLVSGTAVTFEVMEPRAP